MHKQCRKTIVRSVWSNIWESKVLYPWFENETVEEVQCSTENSLQWIGEPASHLFMNSTHTAWFTICNAYDRQHSKRLVFCIHSCILYLSLDLRWINAPRSLIRDTSWFCQKVFSSYFMTLYLNAYERWLI